MSLGDAPATESGGRGFVEPTAVEEDMLRAQLMESEEGEGDLDAAIATVDEVAVEEVRPLRRRQAVRAEDVHQVLELAVKVADDSERGAVGHRVRHHVWQGLERVGCAREELLGDGAPGAGEGVAHVG